MMKWKTSDDITCDCGIGSSVYISVTFCLLEKKRFQGASSYKAELYLFIYFNQTKTQNAQFPHISLVFALALSWLDHIASRYFLSSFLVNTRYHFVLLPLIQLPVSVRHSTPVSSFKSSLKTFLFVKTFSSVPLT